MGDVAYLVVFAVAALVMAGVSWLIFYPREKRAAEERDRKGD